MQEAKRNASLLTAAMTSVLEENISAKLPLNIITMAKKKMPIAVDCTTQTFVANFAACPFPAPSSFATLTLSVYHGEFSLRCPDSLFSIEFQSRVLFPWSVLKK